MRFAMRRVVVVKLAVIAVSIATGFHADAVVTKHFSFRPRQLGIGGGASVVVPVEKRIADAHDRGKEKQRKELSIVGKVTKVVDAGTIEVTPNGGGKRTIRLAKISAPKSADAEYDEAQRQAKQAKLGVWAPAK